MRQLPLRMFHKITFSSDYNGSPCWVWTGYKQKFGYGRTWFQGKLCLVHRVIYELLVGPISDGLHLDHLCRNPSCCNPNHLEPVTQQENIRRGDGVGMVVAQFQRDKTHCIHGHPFDEENTYIRPKGGRGCKACQKQRILKYFKEKVCNGKRD